MYDLKQLHKFKEEVHRQYNIQNIERAKKIISDLAANRIRTSFIFALYEFEQSLGYLWGHEKLLADQEITDLERRFLNIWIKVRKNILDNGNNQIRNLDSDINKVI